MPSEAICQGHGCAEEIESVNVEAFELSGRFLCESCADDLFARLAEQDPPQDMLGKDSTR